LASFLIVWMRRAYARGVRKKFPRRKVIYTGKRNVRLWGSKNED